MKTAEELQKELDEANAKNAENIKALQKSLSEKDAAAKKASEELELLRKKMEEKKGKDGANEEVDGLKKKIEELSGVVVSLSGDRERAQLEKEFPDIAPDLLLGKSDEEKTKIVTLQRERMKVHFAGFPSAHAPTYSPDEVTERIAAIKKMPGLSSEEKILQIEEVRARGKT
jgi:chromosome segregation ATPase